MNEFQKLQNEMRALQAKINQDNYQTRRVEKKQLDVVNRLKVPFYSTLPLNPERGEIAMTSTGLHECRTAGTWIKV